MLRVGFRSSHTRHKHNHNSLDQRSSQCKVEHDGSLTLMYREARQFSLHTYSSERYHCHIFVHKQRLECGKVKRHFSFGLANLVGHSKKGTKKAAVVVGVSTSMWSMVLLFLHGLTMGLTMEE